MNITARPSLGEAVVLLGRLDDARLLAGGHSLIPMMKLRLAQPSHLIDLGGVKELKGVSVAGGQIAIGAMTTQHELIASAALAEAAPILREAAQQIADPQVRSMGTLGGNAANGDPGNDMPALMMALGATYVLSGPAGERQVAARDYYLGIYETALQPGEILAEIRIPAPPKPHGWAYEKLKRKVGDYATAAAAVVMTVVGRPGRDLRDCADQRRRPAAPGRGRSPRGDRNGARPPEPEAGRRRRRGDRRPGRGRPRLGGISHQNGRRHDAPGARARLRPRHILNEEADMPEVEIPESKSQSQVGMTVNGKAVSAEVEPRTLLIHYLREHLNLTGSHIGCDTSHCGACTVDVDGRSVKSCTMFAIQAEGATVVTVEGIAAADGTLHALQEGFREMHGLQCGYCTPGMIVRAYRLLQENANPSEAEIRIGISGNLCRCTGYQNIVRAIQYAAAKLSGVEFREAAE